MGVLRTYQELSDYAITRTVQLPVVAFDCLQDLKRKYGFHSNAEAVSYALATADSLEAFLAVYELVYQGAYREAMNRGGDHG